MDCRRVFHNNQKMVFKFIGSCDPRYALRSKRTSSALHDRVLVQMDAADVFAVHGAP